MEKTPEEEIKYLGRMLTATLPNDTMRIMSISARLLKIGSEDLNNKENGNGQESKVEV